MEKNDSRNIFSESKLDELWQSVTNYRSCEHFMTVMNACARFRHLAPYNAMLVELQCPGARYMLSEREWKDKFDRGIKPNARPLIVLFPFGPVDFLFEIGDTYNLGKRLIDLTDEDILDYIAAPYQTKNDATDEMLNMLTSKLSIHGIALDNNMIAGVGYAAKIELLSNYSHNISIQIGKNDKLNWPAQYLLSVNKNAGHGERFASICHELGHLFCFHLISPRSWDKWQCRNIPHADEEFEAEAVSWLICERLNIGNPSDRYLNNYLSKNKEIPSAVSVERILSAANQIWNLYTKSSINFKDGLLYKNDKAFKKKVTNIKNENKPSLS